jgi:chromate transporter
MAKAEDDAPKRGGVFEVFRVALGLGLTSFGGPIAHLGYFERVYVQRRQWLSAEDYASLVALCQMVPGPASSQLGFLIGLRRAGWWGGLASWLGFLLPSAVLMFAFALLAPRLSGPIMTGVLHGLKLAAVAVVAQAVWSMALRLCPDLARAALALLAGAAQVMLGGAGLQILVLAAGALGGMVLCRHLPRLPSPPSLPVGRRAAWAAGLVFLSLLVALPITGGMFPKSLFDMGALFYRAGALVFGGGHVVLPLLRAALVPTGWMSDSAFLSGYGAAQALPGPLFAFAAYLGAVAAPHGAGLGVSLLWSLTALVFIFLPGLLIAVAGSALWRWVGAHRLAGGAVAGVNAAVVGVLAAALYNPVWITAIANARDVGIAVVALIMLERWRLPPILAVAMCVGTSLLFVVRP